MAYTFSALRAEYAALWAGLRIRPEHKSEAMATARRILANRPNYDPISKETGVPWYLIGIIHSLECSLSFSKHLHNGDSLKARTRNDPKNRPVQWPPDGDDAFEASAIDALTMQGKEFDKIRDWSVDRIAYCLEVYNGFGYRRKSINIHSPYLWSMTTAYTSGKYVDDHVWSSVAVSEQVGGMALLKALIELDSKQIDLDSKPSDAPAWPKAVVTAETGDKPSVASVAKEAPKSRTLWMILTSALTTVAGYAEKAWDMIPSVTGDVETQLGVMASMQKMLKVNFLEITTGVVLTLLAVAWWRHARDKAELKSLKKGD